MLKIFHIPAVFLSLPLLYSKVLYFSHSINTTQAILIVDLSYTTFFKRGNSMGGRDDHKAMDAVFLTSMSFRLMLWFWKWYPAQLNCILYSPYSRSGNFCTVLSSFSLLLLNFFCISKFKAILTQALKLILGMDIYWSTSLEITPSTH